MTGSTRTFKTLDGPEAAVGGPIGLLRDGDIITIDAVDGTLDVDLSEEIVTQSSVPMQTLHYLQYKQTIEDRLMQALQQQRSA